MNGKLKNHRCFKRVVKCLPVCYNANKAWLTSDLFQAEMRH